MSFPSVVATNHGARTSNATSHIISLPNGCNVSGRRAIIFYDLDEQQTITWPSGWTEFASVDGPSGNGRFAAAYRNLDGTEGFSGTGDTVTVTVPLTDGSSHATILIEAGTYDQGTAPEVTTVSQATTGTDPDPPNHTPAGGALDYLWIAAGGADGNVTFTGYPTNYGSNQVTDAGGYAGGTAIGMATRQLNAASENPSAFTISVAEQRTAMTVSIKPVVAGGGSSVPQIIAAIEGSA